MKVTRIVKLFLAAVCFLLVSNTAVAAEEVSWNLDDKNYSLARQWNGSEFYNRTSVDIVHNDDMSFLHIDGGNLQEDLFHFSVSLYEADKWGSGESIWHENYETMQVNIPFSQIREWNLSPGDYLISVAAKSWGEDASLDMYDLCVTEKPGTDEGGGTGVEIPGVDDNKENEIITEPKPEADSPKETKPGKVSIQTIKRTSAKKAKIAWKKIKGSDIKYEVQYASSKKFKKKDTITKNLKKSSITLSKLKNKKYYVKVRAYKVVNGEKVYGVYSKVKTVSKWKK